MGGRGLAIRRTTSIAFAAIVSAVLPATVSAAVTFAPRDDYDIGANVRAVAVGDLNGDGRDDVVTANFTSDTISVLLADQGGALRPPHIYDFGGDQPQDLLLADFNDDGNQDVAVANSSGANAIGTVTVLRGSPTGELTSPTTVTASEDGPDAIAAGHLNGDDQLDLTTSSAGFFDSTALLPQQNGAFGFQVLDTNNDNPSGIVAAKIDDDDTVDITTSHNGGFVQPRFGDGGGQFSNSAADRVLVPGTLLALDADDLDGDGDTDLAVARFHPGEPPDDVTVLRGLGDGGFDVMDPVTVADNPSSVVATDLSGDGVPDLASGSSVSSGPISVLLGDGEAGFERTADLATSSRAVDVASGDVDGDGRRDLVSASFIGGGGADVSVFRNTTDVTAPQIAILSPPGGAVYRRGQRALADYACVDEEPDATGVASCDGSVANGAPIDTSRAGRHEFTVRAVDNNGNERTATVSYRVQAPPQPAPRNPLQQLLDALLRLLFPR